TGEEVLETAPSAAVAAEVHAECLHLDRCRHHSSFNTGRSSTRNTHRPSTKMTRVITAPLSPAFVSHRSGKNAMRYSVKMPARGLNEPITSKGAGRSDTL